MPSARFFENRGAMGAADSIIGDFFPAVWAEPWFFFRLFGEEPVDLFQNEENDGRDDEKIDHCVQEDTIGDDRNIGGLRFSQCIYRQFPQIDEEIAEINTPHKKTQWRHEDICDERAYDFAESGSDDYAHRHIHNIAAEREFFKFFKKSHANSPFQIVFTHHNIHGCYGQIAKRKIDIHDFVAYPILSRYNHIRFNLESYICQRRRSMKHQFFPSYTIGSDAYEAVPEICLDFGKTAVIIGGEKARKAAEPAIRKAAEGKIDILGSFLYGDDCTFENAEALTKIPEVQQADMLFAVGGGRAVDTVKIAAEYLHKPVFTFPTLASNCAPVTKVCAVYYPNHSFRKVWYRERPSYHTFINTGVILHAPRDYFWAGIGDALSKQYEVLFSARGDTHLDFAHSLGVQIAGNCSDELLKYGEKALADFDAKTLSEDFERVVQLIICDTGVVSNCLTHDYNSNLGHAIYNGHTELPHEGHYLHGAVVVYGVLVLLTMDRQTEARDALYRFCVNTGLPHKLADIGENVGGIDELAARAANKPDLNKVPYTVTAPMIKEAILELEELSK